MSDLGGWAVLGVAAGSGLGAVVRALADRRVTARFGPTQLPWATLAVNVAGSLLLGLVLGRSAAAGAGADAVRLVVGTGFCGGLTTFSTASVESWLLLREQRRRAALAYVVLSMGLGLAAVAIGTALAGGFAPTASG
jgi:CrcB protein